MSDTIADRLRIASERKYTCAGAVREAPLCGEAADVIEELCDALEDALGLLDRLDAEDGPSTVLRAGRIILSKAKGAS
jgi:hypothetical protein